MRRMTWVLALAMAGTFSTAMQSQGPVGREPAWAFP